MKKRILSIVLTLCMVLMLVPTTVFAANGDATELQSLLSGGVTVTLSRDYTIDTTLNVTKTVTLDLNGYTIRMTGSGSVIKVESRGNLTLQDSSAAKTGVITGGNASQGGGVYINGGSFTLNGGTIQGCSATSGGGVFVAWGTFTMNGGAIANCSTSSYGGGVHISTGGSMTLYSGTIRGCSATRGGGVHVDNGSFTMTGGTIANCTATTTDVSYGGGGVYNAATYTMSGGVIENCSAASSRGGGVLSAQNFSMSGGSIIRGCSAKYGGGVFLHMNRTMTMTGGTIEACTATGNIISGAVGIDYKASLFANGGTIKGTVEISSDGAIKKTSADGCTVFYDEVTNNGTISGGVFYDEVTNKGTISGGIYYGDIVNKSTGTVSGTYYTVSFNLNGGSGTAPTQWFFNTDTAKALQPADPTREGGIFQGWYNGDTAYNFTEAVTQDITLTAKWVLTDVSDESGLRAALDAGATTIKLTGSFSLSSELNLSDKQVTLDLNGHTLTGSIKLADSSAAPQSILTLIDTAGGGVLNGSITLTRGSGSVSHLYANGGTVTGQVSMPSYAGGIFCTSDTPTVFKDNVGNYGEIHGGIFYGSVKESCIKEKAVTFMNGDSLYALEVVASGKTVAEPAAPSLKNGYQTFAGWYNGDTKYTFGAELSENITLTAVFSDPKAYNISYDLGGGTASNPATYTVESDAITLNNPTKPGYTFTGWSGTGLTGENNMTVTIAQGSTGDRTYTAHYTEKSDYTVVFNANGGSEVPSKTNVKWTDKVLDGVAAPTKANYEFAGWKCGSVAVTDSTEYGDLVTDDSTASVTLVAQWENDTTILQRLLNGGGTVQLTRDYTIISTLNVTNTVTLDLNGYTISMTGSGSVIKVESDGNLTVKDSRPTATHTDASLPAGGVITGGNANQGGGVFAYYGSLTLEGGTIANCSATRGGGGVLVAWGAFTMNGGAIQNCSASSGGGVAISTSGSMTLKGGAIQGCSATRGGGVYNDTTFTMTNGTIANCSATTTDATYGGGGVYNSSSFTMRGGVIENCSAASSYGGGVFSNKDFSMSGSAIIRGCSAKYGGGVRLDNNRTMTMTGGAIEACTATGDGKSDAVSIGQNASLLANGGTIKGTVKTTSGSAIQNTSAGGCTVFYDAVSNYGTISGGIYYGGIQNVGSSSSVTGTYYTVSFDLNGGSGSAPTQWFFNTDTAKALRPADPTNGAYNTFVGWYNGNTAYHFTEAVTESITLTAKYGDPKTYNISYDLDGGTASNPETYTVESDAITLNAPTRPGYTFTGWSGTDLSSNTMIVTIPKGSTGDRAYTAHWRDATNPVISGIENGKTYCALQTVTVSDNDGIASVTVNGDPVTLDTNGQFTLNPATGTQTVVATDNAGNEMTVTVTVNAGHTDESPKDHTCDICGITLSQHSGGTATCTSKATCEYCGKEYGEKNPDNHAGTKVWEQNETQHKQYWNCCDAVVADHQDHIWNNGVCSVCDYICVHKDADHDHICDYGCSVTIGEHVDANKDHVCDYGCTVTIGEHKAADGKHTCDYCGAEMTTCKDDDKNHLCDFCGITLSQHSGGEATCKDKAVCDYCGKEYGELDSSNHTLEKVPAKDATVTETGNKKYWHCKACGSNFSDQDGKNSIELKDTVTQKLPPEIMEGMGQSLTAGEKKDLTFRSNAAFSDFIRVEVDGSNLDAANYTVKEGSTIVTLKADYVATLSAGEHTIGIVSASDTATATFTVQAQSPQTGDSSHMVLWMTLLFVSGSLLTVMGVCGRKKKHSEK